MKSNILFLIIWSVTIVLGTIWSFLMHIDQSAAVAISAWAKHDIIYVLLIGWAFAAFVIMFLYVKSLRPREKEEEKEKDKDKENENVDLVNEESEP